MATFTHLDYFADDFAERARDLVQDGAAFQFEFAGEHFAAVTPFLREGDFDFAKLVREPRYRLLAAVLSLAKGQGCQTLATLLGDRVQVEVSPPPSTPPSCLSGQGIRQALPPIHLRKMRDQNDPLHRACDFLLLESPHELLRIDHINESLHRRRGDPWPDFLIAFASNGCGDYYAYDVRTTPPFICYIDPDKTVHKNLQLSQDQLRFASFEAWYSYVLAKLSPP